MGVVLYRRKNGYIEQQVFPPERFRANIEHGGWYLTVDDIPDPHGDFQSDELKKGELEELKQQAKEAGVKSWHRYKDPEKLKEAIEKQNSFM